MRWREEKGARLASSGFFFFRWMIRVHIFKEAEYFKWSGFVPAKQIGQWESTTYDRPWTKSCGNENNNAEKASGQSEGKVVEYYLAESEHGNLRSMSPLIFPSFFVFTFPFLYNYFGKYQFFKKNLNFNTQSSKNT